MGIITSRFSKKLSTIETLDKIHKDMSRLEQNRRRSQVLQKRIVASLLLYSILLYIIAAVVFYYLYFPKTWQETLLYTFPLIIFPFLVWGARKFTHWYFVQRLSASELALSELRAQKKTILEEVMEKETYKKAKEILEKYDPARFKQLEKPSEVPAQLQERGTYLRQRVRVQPATPRMPLIRSSTPARPSFNPSHTPRSAMGTPAFRPASGPQFMMQAGYSSPPGPPMPRTVLPQKRGAVDKLIDFMVGDGPQNRYALICQQCHSHNGMALPEEFEYLSFRCCYCYYLNTSKKMRPLPPKLVNLQGASSLKPSAESDKSPKNSSE
ncbi:endoplasmic reticulum junction formation protein lunapark-B-like isoform X2 [Pomacea canaliculata]|uniref:endoplasmic reticulum junction formation protein lunapark-B-like isoform X2 n=1 Tax=Pomacea canaliculata TaxID=400727 RepID=UPI000D725A26|nr:endoplasmic reticulum junction formation protein lunapark-B-like isoform X2 [Pomacea canaliculata]